MLPVRLLVGLFVVVFSSLASSAPFTQVKSLKLDFTNTNGTGNVAIGDNGFFYLKDDLGADRKDEAISVASGAFVKAYNATSLIDGTTSSFVADGYDNAWLNFSLPATFNIKTIGFSKPSEGTGWRAPFINIRVTDENDNDYYSRFLYDNYTATGAGFFSKHSEDISTLDYYSEKLDKLLSYSFEILSGDLPTNEFESTAFSWGLVNNNVNYSMIGANTVAVFDSAQESAIYSTSQNVHIRNLRKQGLSAWINPTSISAETVVVNNHHAYVGSNNTANGGTLIGITADGRPFAEYVLQQNTNTYTDTQGNASSTEIIRAYGNSIVPLNTWTKLSAFFTESSVALYVNGILASTISTTEERYWNSAQPGRKFSIGALVNYTTVTKPFNGLIDSPTLYSEYLSASEVLDYYQSEASLFNSAPVISGIPLTSISENQNYSFTPTATDADGDTLTFSVTNLPSWTSFNTETGELSGSPDFNDSGAYNNIQISVSDGANTSSLSSFDIAVINTNRAPSINGSPTTFINENQAYSFTPSASDLDNDLFTFSVVNKPAWATFNTKTGTLSGTPTPPEAMTYSNIIISVSDGTDTNALASFDITVNGAPKIMGGFAIPTSIVGGDTYSFLPWIVDPNGTAGISFSLTNKPSWMTITTSTGRLGGTPTNSDAGTYSGITLTVTDGYLSNELNFNVTVTTSNLPPTITGNPAKVINAGSSYSFLPTGTDPNNDTLTYSINNKPAWAAFNTTTGQLSSDGALSQSDADVYSNVVITVTDGEESASLDPFSIKVNGAPVITQPTTQTAIEDTPFSYTPVAADPNKDTLTFSINQLPDWASFNAVTGEISGTPDFATAGTEEGLIYSVSDGNLSADSGAFSIIIQNTNRLPTIEGTPVTSVNENDAYSFTPTASDQDGETLTFSIVNKPDWAVFDDSTGQLSGKPSFTDAGIYNDIVISVSDGIDTVALASFDLTVVNLNQAPTIIGTPAGSLKEGNEYSFIPKTSDLDGDQLTFSVENLPSWAEFDTATGELSGTPQYSHSGTYENILISVSDGVDTIQFAPFTINIMNQNRPPVLSGDPLPEVAENELFEFTPQLQVFDTATATFSVTGQPEWADFNAETGQLTGTPLAEHVNQAYDITIEVTDGNELTTALPMFTLMVTNVNDTPVFNPLLSNYDVETGEAVQILATAVDIDENDQLTYTATGLPRGITLDSTTGLITGVAESQETQSYSIEITVTDLAGASQTVPFNLNILNSSSPQSDNMAPTVETLSLSTSINQTIDAQIQAMDDKPETILSYTLVSQPNLGEVSLDGSKLVYTPMKDIFGNDQFTISVSDGEQSTQIDVPVIIEWRDVFPPIIQMPEIVELNASGVLTPISESMILENQKFDISDSGSDYYEINSDLEVDALRSGRHNVTWTVKDANGNSAKFNQILHIFPQVSLSAPSVVLEGDSTIISIQLTGESPVSEYNIPLELMFLDGNIAESSVTLNSENVTFNNGETETTVEFHVSNTSINKEDGQFIVKLGNVRNKSSNSEQLITVTERNIPPKVSLAATMGGKRISTINKTDSGVVHLKASVRDPNLTDSHTLSWTSSRSNDVLLNQNTSLIEMDVDLLAVGIHKFTVTAEDNHGATGETSLFLRVLENTPTLSPEEDSDADGISDADEGITDDDGDGLLDFVDPLNSTTIMQEFAHETERFLAICEQGTQCRLGEYAMNGANGGIRISPDEFNKLGIYEDTESVNIGGLFDFEITNIEVGSLSRIVIPLTEKLPEDAVYRKFDETSGWKPFETNRKNYLSSAPGLEGVCPSPGHASYTEGLNAGDWCIQITLEDGGPNDADNRTNGTIVDPGGISVTSTDEQIEGSDDNQNINHPESDIDIVDNNAGSQETTIETSVSGGGSFHLFLICSLCLLTLYSRISVKSRSAAVKTIQ